MGFFSELEENLEKYIDKFFLKPRPGEQLQPVDIARQMAREMRRKRRAGLTGVFVPNRYEITLGENDYTALEPLLERLASELKDFITEKAAEKRYDLTGSVVVEFKVDRERDTLNERLYITGYYDLLPAEEPEAQSKTQREDTQRFIPVRVPQQPSPAPIRKSRVLLQNLSGGLEQYEINQELTVIGRREICDIYLSDVGISRKHAVITRSGNHFVISDQASSNGTYVNGIRITSQVLEPGDVIKMGSTVLTFK
ncbi:MAG: hypothetical protein JL56_08360 [Desulfotomaculum sp. BICA1-6]|nr:MAG: hypothetical protein JL56_08360 [Desulfotomaculum sp. BICA1-6]